MTELKLNLDLKFADLYQNEGLRKLDAYFISYLQKEDSSLCKALLENRNNFTTWQKEHSQLIVQLAPCLEEFIANVFSIKNELEKEKSKHENLAKVYECKRLFVQRNALKSGIEVVNDIAPYMEKLSRLISENIDKYEVDFFEQIFSENVLLWLKNNQQEELKIAATYAVWACFSEEGIKRHKSGVLFKFVHKIDFENLIKLNVIEENEIKHFRIADDQLHYRQGFALTDHGCRTNFAVDQASYCIHCHNQGKDSCSKGLKEDIKGCPLDEKISEMNLLKSKASVIGALAVAIIDNPMLAATGHRICNDCMKACIYQKQEPVNIPQIETRVLKDVLNLPWGFEIYSLLTKWNPLSFKHYLPKEETNFKVLVVGMGPAGFTLSHYLLNQGHIVVGIDGLKIEDIPEEILTKPIKNTEALFEALDKRVVNGFGGVMEYGITNRWNKNFLLLIRLLLERRKNFKLFSGVRFGSNITPDQAFELGFDHIALALGAGSPNLLDIKDTMAKGVRTASDFLMSLQLGTPYRQDAISNLQIRMPVVVIGGGLTALDAATEAAAYYPELVKKFSAQFNPDNLLNEEEKQIANEFIAHAELFKQNNSLKELGGVKILYRNKLQKSPSYRLNHEELNLGLSEGIDFVESIIPTKIILDKFGHVEKLEAVQEINGEKKNVVLPAKTILIAAGTVPNTVLEKEYTNFFQKDGKYFNIIEDDFIVYKGSEGAISIFGDLHPKYAGNVVKAMASSKKGFPVICKMLKQKNNANSIDNYIEFFKKLDHLLVPKLIKINRLADNIVELLIRSPLAAKNFKPGQFFKLQNYYDKALPLMEPLALTGAKILDDTISTIVLEMGASSNLCSKLKESEKVVFMGPAGTPTKICSNEKVMLIGGGLGNAVLFSIGQAFKKQNSEVLYFAGYKKAKDRYKIEEIEAASDQIVWCCDEEALSRTREQDLSFKGNIVEAILNYARVYPEKLKTIDKIIVIGSDKMMHAIKKARKDILKPYLKEEHKAIASINSPMQCMMKEICGQCIQKHIDPETKEETYIFSCTNQDQDIDVVDFIHLKDRLSQNKLMEKTFI